MSYKNEKLKVPVKLFHKINNNLEEVGTTKENLPFNGNTKTFIQTQKQELQCIHNNDNNNNLILILRAFHEMIKRALHDFYL